MNTSKDFFGSIFKYQNNNCSKRVDLSLVVSFICTCCVCGIDPRIFPCGSSLSSFYSSWQCIELVFIIFSGIFVLCVCACPTWVILWITHVLFGFLSLLMFSSILGALNFTAPLWLVVIFHGVLCVWPCVALSDIILWNPGRVWSTTCARWYLRVPRYPNHLVCAW